MSTVLSIAKSTTIIQSPPFSTHNFIMYVKFLLLLFLFQSYFMYQCIISYAFCSLSYICMYCFFTSCIAVQCSPRSIRFALVLDRSCFASHNSESRLLVLSSSLTCTQDSFRQCRSIERTNTPMRLGSHYFL